MEKTVMGQSIKLDVPPSGHPSATLQSRSSFGRYGKKCWDCFTDELSLFSSTIRAVMTPFPRIATIL